MSSLGHSRSKCHAHAWLAVPQRHFVSERAPGIGRGLHDEPCLVAGQGFFESFIGKKGKVSHDFRMAIFQGRARCGAGKLFRKVASSQGKSAYVSLPRRAFFEIS